MKREKRKPEKESICSVLKSIYVEFAGSTSAHGFQWSIRRRSGSGFETFIRYLWFFISTGFLIGAFVATFDLIKTQFSKPKHSTQYNIIKGEQGVGIESPHFILCDPNPFHKQKALEMNISTTVVSYLTNYLFFDRRTHDNQLNMLENLTASYTETLSRFNNSPVLLLDAVTKNCSEFIIFCQVGYRTSGHGDCCNYFTPEYVRGYKCYSTQGKVNHTVFEAGTIAGTTIGVLASRAVGYLDQNIAPWLSYTLSGVGIAVTDQRRGTWSSVEKSLKLLSDGTYNNIAVSKTVKNRSAMKNDSLLQRYTCVDSTNEKDHLHLVGNHSWYNYDLCRKHGQLSYCYQLLNCSWDLYRKLNDSEFCTPIQYNHYYYASVTELLEVKDRTNFSFNDCPEDCIEEEFFLEISSTNLTPEMIALAQSGSADVNGEDLVILNVYMRTMDYTEIAFSVYGWSDLMSDVGGNFGLMFGGSLITLIELLMFLYFSLIYLIKKAFKRIF